MNAFIKSVPRDVVVVEGAEAEPYLHGQISQDVNDMTVGESRLSFLLEPRGKIESLFRITRSGDQQYVLDTEFGHGELLLSSLARFKLRSKVEFVGSRWQMISILGQADASQANNFELVAASSWPGIGYSDLLGESPSLDLPECSSEDYERLRLSEGLPVIGSEVAVGDVPNETDLLDLAVSFDKGCYRGQELVERIDARSGGRRLIRRVQSESALGSGDALEFDGEIVGEVLTSTSSGPYVGFARLRADVEVVDGPDGEPVNVSSIHQVAV
ncbi:MAG: hypothetical protein VX785_01245 [Actinomycetota bacterium]|nr:hypothetical protein [Acidimicrobiales bacterium]MED5551311.1 hypothetical protein [Actinomycetota bacterium]MEE2680621.1 hypothetical protein [Actinomycetota bacterium]MEE3187266.1 hypothetical protein [Actinomycetota bacterium]MEE3256756.1 hypothetical protein [Actinomycetota bacterium]|tara:strand:- start:22324 stop:23139 length:816 start_codon:yes stop_codon:yes gene_type:complete